MAETPRKRRHKTNPPPLTAMEIRFAQLWVESSHQRDATTRSYLAAGFPRGKTDNATNQAAFHKLRRPAIRAYIRELQSLQAQAAKLSIAEIAVGIANIARADRRKLYDKRGNVLPPDQWPDDVAATVEEISSEEILEAVEGERGKKRLKGYARKVKTGARLPAWKVLADWKRMLTDNDKLEAMSAEIAKLRALLEEENAPSVAGGEATERAAGAVQPEVPPSPGGGVTTGTGAETGVVAVAGALAALLANEDAQSGGASADKGESAVDAAGGGAVAGVPEPGG